MSAISILLLLAAAVAAVVGGAALYAVRGLRRELAGLRAQLAPAEHGAPARSTVPAPRTSPDIEDIRSAVAEALAEERERELAEARAFWAAQEARDARADGPLLEGRGTEYEGTGLDAAMLDALLERALGGVHEGEVFLPRHPGREGAEPGADAPRPAGPASGEEAGAAEESEDGDADGEPDPAELAAARRRHPSDPRHGLDGEPVGRAPGGPETGDSTRRRLAELADSRTPLTDVRSGPLGTLDVYVFADGTTVCLAPGHREPAERLAAALDEGAQPVLVGGSGVLGAYSLTFAYGEESVYVLADRVIASP
ncbi:hypothetical protein GCM10010420_50120 [Streptomyces glaucosporus]|uniref:Secreted protein n=1 Tax=Streptomyces glaucosporus TaxID=284044 RepID=A0ABN3IVX7_9ACTN